MKSRAIFVNAFNRPRYLRVCLDAISKCHDLEKWDVWVDFDGGSVENFAVCNSSLFHYRVIRPKNIGPRDHPTEMLRTALECGYEKIIYCDDDALFRRDLPNILDEQPKRPELISAYHGMPSGSFSYMSISPVLLFNDMMSKIVEFMDRAEYVGLPNVCFSGIPIERDTVGHDYCWFAWCVRDKVPCWFSDKHLSLNFGYLGFNHHMDQNKAISLETSAFHGGPETWMDGVLTVAQTTDAATVLGTPGFVYA